MSYSEEAAICLKCDEPPCNGGHVGCPWWELYGKKLTEKARERKNATNRRYQQKPDVKAKRRERERNNYRSCSEFREKKKERDREYEKRPEVKERRKEQNRLNYQRRKQKLGVDLENN